MDEASASVGISPDLIHEIFKSVWEKASQDVAKADESNAGATSKRTKSTTANANALKLSCELLKLFVTEAVGRAGIIAEAEGKDRIEATHFERMLPQFLLDF
ncbi:protein MHF2 homolog [Selaginella moellendorffii]|uniref:protein MHF2 homolog n=1 Tax=Selaginella moellendorffii TaxID=88036 RepID=UPI000D1CF144|nr:protein MHF2 homolog [Selaginella moellendorffii]|eukprot:XP_024540113.1 protein MHF2 homolog [Selaginella moellendorffii]